MQKIWRRACTVCSVAHSTGDIIIMNKLSLILETLISSAYAWDWPWKNVLRKKFLKEIA